MRLMVVTTLYVCLLLLTVFETAHTAGEDASGYTRRRVSFASRSDVPTAANPVAISIGDFNGDGRLDIATVSHPLNFPSSIPNVLTILLGEGDARFRAIPDLVLGTNLGSVAMVTGDFNGDGSLDLAVLNEFDNSVSILIGQGDGTFQVTGVVPVAIRPVALVVADFNNDGLVDLAVLNSPPPPDPFDPPPPGSLSILLGQGDGTFQALTPVAVGLVPGSLAVGDFNNDGIADLAMTSAEGASVLIGLGSGAFQAPQVVSPHAARFVAVGDLDGDGRADLAMVAAVTGAQTSISIQLGQGDGTFQAVSSVLVNGNRPSALAIEDLDGDQIPDLVIVDLASSTLSIAKGLGDGTFTALPAIAVGREPVAVSLGDFNGDGRPDLATANRTGNDVSMLLSRRRGGFDVAPAYSTGACCPSSLVVGDFDGDGLIDLAESNFPDKTISILKGLGHGRFQPGTRIPVVEAPWEMAGADFDGDGQMDLAITNAGLDGPGNTVSILLGQGDGTFRAAPTITVGRIPVAIVSADLNGDGRPDLAVTNDTDGTVSILLGRGDGTFQAAPTVSVGRNPLAMTAADLNGDGCIDLVVANTNQNGMALGSISILLGQCDGTFETTPEITVGSRPISVAVGDLDGDGRLDVVVANQFGNPPISILMGNGDGTVHSAPDVAVRVDRVVLADFNGDGRLDLAVANLNTNYVAILLGSGDGTFKIGLFAGVGQAPEFMVQADFNGHGLPDLATADYEGQTVTILINRTRTDLINRTRTDGLFDDDAVFARGFSMLRDKMFVSEHFPPWRRMGM